MLANHVPECAVKAISRLLSFAHTHRTVRIFVNNSAGQIMVVQSTSSQFRRSHIKSEWLYGMKGDPVIAANPMASPELPGTSGAQGYSWSGRAKSVSFRFYGDSA